jgi:uncharacterized membrane protein YccF (DUF307 family)
MNLILNLLWIFLGGFVMALGWVFAAALMAITIIFLPWAPAAFRIAAYSLMPFGQHVEEREEGPVMFLGNVVWFLLAGWWLALGHLLLAVAFGITIIGLPFAWAHLKLAGLSLAPLGKAVVPNEL